MATTDRPQFKMVNAFGYPLGLAFGSFAGFHLIAGFEQAWNGWPLQAAGFVTVGYSLAYAINPILYDFGPSIKRLERKTKKTFLTAHGERTIQIGNAQISQSSALVRWPKQMQYSVQSPVQVLATRDVIFTHNGKRIPGSLYDRWLTDGYARQLQFERDGKRKSGLTRAERGEISQPHWGRLRDILAFTVEWYTQERGILLASDINGGFVLRHKPAMIYDCTCAVLSP